MGNQLLLVADVDHVGRSGDVVSVKPGYARNFLIPQKKAVIADKFTLRLQERLKLERTQRAAVDKREGEELAAKIEGMTITMETKVDPDGHMYGSVSALDIVHALEKQGFSLEKRNVVLLHPIKALGVHPINLRLKEGVTANITLRILSDVEAAAERAEQGP